MWVGRSVVIRGRNTTELQHHMSVSPLSTIQGGMLGRFIQTTKGGGPTQEEKAWGWLGTPNEWNRALQQAKRSKTTAQAQQKTPRVEQSRLATVLP